MLQSLRGEFADLPVEAASFKRHQEPDGGDGRGHHEDGRGSGEKMEQPGRVDSKGPGAKQGTASPLDGENGGQAQQGYVAHAQSPTALTFQEAAQKVEAGLGGNLRSAAV